MYSLSFERLAAPSPVDARGLLPLDRARAIVASATAFARYGVPSSDELWAALLSLADANEFVREALRLDWQFPYLRGWDNEDAVIRYGAGALPWLSALAERQGGVVGSIPALPWYFVGTHLLAVGPDAVDAVLRTRREHETDGHAFLGAWLARHGQAAWRALGDRALSGDAAARTAVDALSARSPSSVKKQLGKELAARLDVGRKRFEARTILDLLDAAAAASVGDRLPWPSFTATAGHFEYHAMRVAAVRAKTGDDWGILVEVVQGDALGDEEDVRWPATVQHYAYGSKVAAGGSYLEDAHPIPASVAQERIDDARVAALDLRPGHSTTGAVERWSDVLRLRAAVATRADDLFTPAAKVAALVGVLGGELLVLAQTFEHVSGTAYGQGAFRRLPSQSASWRSIAEAIASRARDAFDPATPNTDWRLHAVHVESVPDAT